MKQVIFALNEKKSYFKNTGWRTVKPSVQGPLIVPFVPGGVINLTINENSYTAFAESEGLKFVTDQFAKNPYFGITGNLQTFKIGLHDFNMKFDPLSGLITKNNITPSNSIVIGPDDGKATIFGACSILGSSSLIDGNSPKFDITNGLGCGGGLILDIGVGNIYPASFYIYIEAMVGLEDTDGDRHFETICPSGVWKEFIIEYDPPKIKIIFPDNEFRLSYPLKINIVQAIRFTDLLKLVKNESRAFGKTTKIEGIELVNAPDMLLVFLDSNGKIYGGGMSRKRAELIRIPAVEVKNMLIGITPSLGLVVTDI